MPKFCQNCGEFTSNENATHCLICHKPLIIATSYNVSVFNPTTQKIEQMEVEKAKNYIRQGLRLPVDISESGFNVVIDGEYNGVPTGKKIKEKNEQLKKKWDTYEKDKRSVKEETQKQLTEKRKQQGLE